MKNFFPLGLFLLGACSFAPITVGVDDFFIQAGSSRGQVCYTQITESVSVNFKSVFYEGDALYSPGPSIGDNSTVEMAIYGRATDPDPSSSEPMKCITATGADLLLADGIVLEAGERQRIRAGGSDLADLVTRDSYWLGGSLNDDALLSAPGDISFTNGVVKANF